MPAPSPPPADTAPGSPPVAAADLPALPPSIAPEKLLAGETYTYASPIPASILANPDEPVILGVDEAGRGPVLGPMVYAAAYCLESYSDAIKALGFDDSKKLTHSSRAALMATITDPTSTLYTSLGWTTALLSPSTISTGMLRPSTHTPYNLNTLAHDTTISLIRSVLAQKVNLKAIYIDTVGLPHVYQAKLQQLFPTLSVTVTKQADSLFPIVSAASICAKVTRDIALDTLVTKAGDAAGEGNGADEVLGSGYPGDAKTIKYLKDSLDPVFGWRGEVVRFSWATAKDLIDKDKRAVKAEWAEVSDEGQAITGFFSSEKEGDGVEKGVGGWYGRGGGLVDF